MASITIVGVAGVRTLRHLVLLLCQKVSDVPAPLTAPPPAARSSSSVAAPILKLWSCRTPVLSVVRFVLNIRTLSGLIYTG